jgi:hypothetical protein
VRSGGIRVQSAAEEDLAVKRAPTFGELLAERVKALELRIEAASCTTDPNVFARTLRAEEPTR